MKKLKMTVVMTASFILLLMGAVSFPASAEDITSQVNIVLADGTIMIYAGSDAGINVGDKFEARRGGEVVGHIIVTKTKNLFTYAEMLDGDVQEMDQVIRTETASAEKKKPETSEKKEDSEKTADTKEKKAKKPKKEKKTRSSTRRDKAKEPETDEDTEPAKAEKEEPKKKSRKPKKEKPAKKPKPIGKVFPPEKKKNQSQYPPIGGVRASGFGLSGLFFMPTGNTIPKGRGNIHFMYSDANDDRLSYTHTGVGVGYGLNENMEIAYTHISTSYDVPTGYISVNDSKIHVFSFKYQMKRVGSLANTSDKSGQSRYALGAQYFTEGSNNNNNVATTTSVSSLQATRLYAVATVHLSMGAGHAGVYYQTGSMVDNTDDDGVGILAGLEYPLGIKSGSSFKDSMSLISEYDSKAFYLGTAKTPSLGLRYGFRERGHVTLGVLDFTETSTLLLEGAYDY